MLRLVTTLSQLTVLSCSLWASCIQTRLGLSLAGLHIHVGPKAITWVCLHHIPHRLFCSPGPAASLD